MLDIIVKECTKEQLISLGYYQFMGQPDS